MKIFYEQRKWHGFMIADEVSRKTDSEKRIYKGLYIICVTSIDIEYMTVYNNVHPIHDKEGRWDD